MSKTEYKEDWSKHNFACTEVKRECALPSEFDSAIFDAEQRQIIADYLSDYRTEVTRTSMSALTDFALLVFLFIKQGAKVPLYSINYLL